MYEEKPDPLSRPFHQLSEAQTVAEHSDLVILCLGLDETLEGEEGDAGNAYASGDKRDLRLPECQQRLLETIAACGTPFVVCMMAGSAMDFTYADKHANAVLQAWYPGARGGKAVAKLLFGKTMPAGKLPVTFYRDLEDFPDFTDYSMKKRTYRYLEKAPMYPFGYGLGYGKAEIENVQVEAGFKNGVLSYQEAAKNGIEVRVRLKNASDWLVHEVLQAYVRVEGTEYEVRNHKLAAFLRVTLGTDEEQEVSLSIPSTAFMTVNEQGKRQADGTHATVWIGFGQPDERTRELTGAECVRLEVR